MRPRSSRAIRFVAAGALATGVLVLVPGAAPSGASPFVFEQTTDAPINDSQDVTSLLNVPADTCQGPLDDVNIAMDWTHTYNGDLDVTLTSPANTVVTLFTDVGDAGDNGSVLLDDEAEAVLPVVSSALNGWFLPEAPATLSAFDGQNPSGNWALTIVDDAGQDVGTLTNWELSFTCFDESFDLDLHATGPVPIPDNGTGALSVDLGRCDNVTDVDTEVVLQHTLVSDLVIELSHGAEVVTLWDSNSVTERGAWVLFDDEEADAIQSIVAGGDPQDPWPLGFGGFSPDEALSTFDGTDGAGTWTLTVRDVVGQDDGELQQFGIDVSCQNDPDPVACDNIPEDGFTDMADHSTHEDNVDCIAFYGIAQGIGGGLYGHQNPVSRAQIASFTARTIEVAGGDLPNNPPDAFPGDDGGTHEPNINALAEIGVIGGNGETGANYNVSESMRRDHMASFLYNAYEFIIGAPMPDGPDAFTDDNGNPFEQEINALAAAGVVVGTGGGNYDPAGTVSRGSMGSFLARFLQVLVDDGAVLTPI